MGQIWIPKQFTGGVLAELQLDKIAYNHVTMTFERIVYKSFRDQAEAGTKSEKVPMVEVKRRIEILIRYFKIMRGDLKWSIQRTLDMIPKALRSELEGKEFTIPKRSVWTPEGY